MKVYSLYQFDLFNLFFCTTLGEKQNKTKIQFLYQVFGAYVSAPWHSSKTPTQMHNNQSYYGTGETFVFELKHDLSHDPPQEQKINAEQEKQPEPQPQPQPHEGELRTYKWAGENNYFMTWNNKSIAVGGG